MKLSKPQSNLLKSISDGPMSVVDHYPPAKILVSKGLAEWNKYGRLTITSLGKNHLTNTKS